MTSTAPSAGPDEPGELGETLVGCVRSGDVALGHDDGRGGDHRRVVEASGDRADGEQGDDADAWPIGGDDGSHRDEYCGPDEVECDERAPSVESVGDGTTDRAEQHVGQKACEQCRRDPGRAVVAVGEVDDERHPVEEVTGERDE